jgi:hypothetical protein
MKRSLQNLGKYIDLGDSKYFEGNLSKCQFLYLRSHMGWPGIEPGPPKNLKELNVKKIKNLYTHREEILTLF